MADTATSLLKLRVQTVGGNSNTWGGYQAETNQMLEEAISGRLAVAVTTGDVTLDDTQYDPAVNESHYAVLHVTGAKTAARAVIVPNRTKIYIVVNDGTSTGGPFQLTVKPSAGTGHAMDDGEIAILAMDGAGAVDVIFSSVDYLSTIEVSSDTTPQLGGDLDANTFNILMDDATGINDDSDNEQLTFQKTASAVNNWEMTNAATGTDPNLAVVGSDTNINAVITPKGSGVLKSGSTAVGLTGKQTIWVPATAMSPTASNGCAALAQVETTAGRPDLNVLDFDATADEHAQFTVAFPKSWNLGTVTFSAYWTTTATDTDGVAWGLQGVATANSDTLDVAYGTAIVVTDANDSAAEDCMITAESSAVTIAGTPADEDLVTFRIFRDVSDAADTMTEDARLLGIKLYFTTDTGNDA